MSQKKNVMYRKWRRGRRKGEGRGEGRGEEKRERGEKKRKRDESCGEEKIISSVTVVFLLGL